MVCYIEVEDHWREVKIWTEMSEVGHDGDEGEGWDCELDGLAVAGDVGVVEAGEVESFVVDAQLECSRDYYDEY